MAFLGLRVSCSALRLGIYYVAELQNVATRRADCSAMLEQLASDLLGGGDFVATPTTANSQVGEGMSQKLLN